MATCVEADRIKHEIIFDVASGKLDEFDAASGKLDLDEGAVENNCIIEQAERRAIVQSTGVRHLIHCLAVKSAPHPIFSHPGRNLVGVAVQDLGAAMQQPTGFRQTWPAEDFQRV